MIAANTEIECAYIVSCMTVVYFHGQGKQVTAAQIMYQEVRVRTTQHRIQTTVSTFQHSQVAQFYMLTGVNNALCRYTVCPFNMATQSSKPRHNAGFQQQ
jgi:hypothetical protein